MVLDRKISDQRIYPAVDIFLSGTRREELLMQPWELEKINLIRRGLAEHKPGEAIERLLMFVKKIPDQRADAERPSGLAVAPKIFEVISVALEHTPGGHRPPLQEVDWEVLPPEEKRKREGLEPLFKWLALIMDEFLR